MNTAVAVVDQPIPGNFEIVKDAPFYGHAPLMALSPSPFNRKFFTEKGLTELTANIRSLGYVFQPLLCRPLPPAEDGSDRFEIVCGERRWRGANMAGIATVPILVKAFTDKEVCEIQLIENLQREGAHPVEEGEGYAVLMKDFGHNVESVAATVSRSVAYVYGRLKLRALAPDVRALVFEKEIDGSIAELIARIPVARLQAQALEEIAKGQNGEPMSFRKAKTHIQDRYTLTLSEAKFSKTDIKLVAAAGSCDACPKRTGSQPILYPDVPADVCTDPDCFESKHEAHNALKLKEAEKAKAPIVEVQAIWQATTGNLVAGTTSAKQFQRIKPGTNGDIEDLLSAEEMPKPVKYAKIASGDVVAIFDKTAIQAALEKAGLCETVESHTEKLKEKLKADTAAKKTEKAKETQTKLKQLEDDDLAHQESTFRSALYARVRQHTVDKLDMAGALKVIAKFAFSEWSLDHSLASHYNFTSHRDKEFEKFVHKASEIELAVFLTDLALSYALDVTARDMKDGKHLEDPDYLSLVAMAKAAKIDVDAVREEVTPKPAAAISEPVAETRTKPAAKKQPARPKAEKKGPAVKAAPKKHTQLATKEKVKAPADSPILPVGAWPFPKGGKV